MYYFSAYSIYLEKCDPGGKGTGKNVTGYSVSTYKLFRLAVTLFSRIFTGKGTIGNMGCDSAEHKGQSLE